MQQASLKHGARAGAASLHFLRVAFPRRERELRGYHIDRTDQFPHRLGGLYAKDRAIVEIE
jgi:hypothetical protein